MTNMAGRIERYVNIARGQDSAFRAGGRSGHRRGDRHRARSQTWREGAGCSVLVRVPRVQSNGAGAPEDRATTDSGLAPAPAWHLHQRLAPSTC